MRKVIYTVSIALLLELYGQVVLGQWSGNSTINTAISTATNFQEYPAMTDNGAGGAIIAWQDFRGGNNYDIYAQRINSDGTLGLPAPFSTAGALHFDGIDDYVQKNGSVRMEYLPLTLQAWVKPERRNDGTTINQFPNSVISNDLPGRFGTGLGATVLGQSSGITIEYDDGFRYINYPLSGGEWYQITVVFTFGNIRTYVDGNLIDNFSFLQTSANNTSYFLIGKHNDDVAQYGSRRFFLGAIDEIRIWRRDLSPEEISNSNCELPTGQEGLMVYYKFNQGEAEARNAGETVLVDASGNNNSAILYNFTLDGATSNWVSGSTVPGLTTFYYDSDGDGFGDANVTTQACSPAEGYVEDNTDCDDSDEGVYPNAPETCDGKDNDCNGQTDEGLTSTFYRDNDADGFGNPSTATQACSSPVGYVSDNTDGNDNDPSMYPGAIEGYDGKDNNGNGQTDEGIAVQNASSVWNWSISASDPALTISPRDKSLLAGGHENYGHDLKGKKLNLLTGGIVMNDFPSPATRNPLWVSPANEQDILVGGYVDKSAYNVDGSFKWLWLSGCCNGTPFSIDIENGKGYLIQSKFLNRVNLSNGARLGGFEIDTYFGHSSIFDANTLYVSGTDGAASKLNPNSAQIWRVLIDPTQTLRPGAIASDGSYIVTSGNDHQGGLPSAGYLARITQDGQHVWKQNINAVTIPVIGGNGFIYVGTQTPPVSFTDAGSIKAYRVNGNNLELVWNAPTMGLPNDIIVADNGKLYAVVGNYQSGQLLELDQNTGAVSRVIENLPGAWELLLQGGVLYTSGASIFNGQGSITAVPFDAGEYDPASPWPVRYHDNQRTSNSVAPHYSLPTYCHATTGNAAAVYSQYISKVEFAGINNISGLGSAPDYYTDFTNNIATISRSGSYPITISKSSGQSGPTFFGVWIDWNNNGSFGDPGEFVFNRTLDGTEFVATGTIDVPASASYGKLQMRVMSHVFTSLNGGQYCDQNLYGAETEDYLVEVKNCNSAQSYLSGAVIQPVVSDIARSSANNQIITVQIAMAGDCPATEVSSINFTTQGSDNPDINISSAKVYYTGNDPIFHTNKLFGTIDNPNGTFIINGSQKLVNGTNYFWLVYDIPDNAYVGEVVDATCESISTIGAGIINLSNGNPAGSRTIDYCRGSTGNATVVYGQFINNVTFAGINNNSGAANNPPEYYSSYVDGMVGTVVTGGNYSISISRNRNSSGGNGFGVWIDWNNNGSFGDDGEFVFSKFANTELVVSGNISAPFGVSPGPHRMRVKTNVFHAVQTSDYCANLYGAETEDYTIIVTAVTCPEDKVVSTDAGGCSAIVNDIDPVSVPSGTHVQMDYILSGATTGAGTGTASGLQFNKGVTTISYAPPGNPIPTCTFSVTVQDTENPDFNAPADYNMSLDGQCTLTIPDLVGSLTGLDNCGNITFSQLPAPGSVVSSGHNLAHIISIKADDGNGNSIVKQVTVTATDNTPPMITAPTARVFAADGSCVATNANLGSPVYADNCPGVTLSNNAPVTFLKGITTVIWTATDVAGNKKTASQSVTVQDLSGPAIQSCTNMVTHCYNANSTYSIPAIVARDNCDVSLIYAYSITGATIRTGVGNNASGLFNPGISNIHWTVADASFNRTNCNTQVKIDKLDASIPDAYANGVTASMGVANTIYLGYGNGTIALTAQPSSSLSPNNFTYKWTIGSPAGPGFATTQSITVSPASTTTYFVSVKDANNCSPISQVSKQVKVMDIRCGTNKIYVCERKQNGSYNTKCVSATNLNLSTGSYLGQCTTGARTIATTKGIPEPVKAAAGLNISVFPNPSQQSFNIIIGSDNQNEIVVLRVTNILGNVIQSKDNIIAGQTVRIGENYTPGVYFVEAIQGENRKVIKIIKL